METIRARQALTPKGWCEGVEIDIGADGIIADVRTGCAFPDPVAAIALPAPGNLHSHAFQRAMAGLTERRGATPTDSFWTWRELMYRFLDRLTPDDIEAIAAQTFMEMLEAGYGAVAEFHYLHHQADGSPYERVGELGARIFAAAAETGIGLTHLPVLYTYGGLDRRPLQAGQKRFGCDMDRFARLVEDSAALLGGLPADARLGVAPHSLRAVAPEDLTTIAALRPEAPVHMHIAEQAAEIEEVEIACGTRPVRWLMNNADVDRRWCLIHATHMVPDETEMLAHSGAIAGLCPITESNLGDGIFDGRRFVEAGGTFGVGSDSNVRIALSDELRTLEYSQRLKERRRAVLATPQRSAGRLLFETAAVGGARALGRNSGAVATGNLADITCLDGENLTLAVASGDEILDAWIFAGDDRVVRDVWSAGRHVVTAGRHLAREQIEARYRAVIKRLRAEL